MSNNTRDPQSNGQADNQHTTSRRELLRTTAIVPVLGIRGSYSGIDDSSSTAIPLVDEEALPSNFEEYAITEPVPFARTLREADDRFTQHDIAVAAYTEGPDQMNPRYTAATMAVSLPSVDAIPTVRSEFIDGFEDMMDEYDMLPEIQWTRQRKESLNPQSVRLYGSLQVHHDTVANLEWITSNTQPQFDELWALDATDDTAVMTVVFGYQDGPWQPRSLFEQTTDHVRQYLQDPGGSSW